MTSIRLVVITGPSGTGKSTILNRAIAEHPNTFGFSVSHTTRNPRQGETPGVHYHYITRMEFEQMIEDKKFVEHAEFGGNLYGTSWKAIEDIQNSGLICVLDVDLQGVRQLKDFVDKMSEETRQELGRRPLMTKFLLIRAPSIEILEQRLRLRGTESEKDIQKRLHHAREDDLAALSEPHFFDKVIVNEDEDAAYAEFLDAIKEELDQLNNAHSDGSQTKDFDSIPVDRFPSFTG